MKAICWLEWCIRILYGRSAERTVVVREEYRGKDGKSGGRSEDRNDFDGYCLWWHIAIIIGHSVAHAFALLQASLALLRRVDQRDAMLIRAVIVVSRVRLFVSYVGLGRSQSDRLFHISVHIVFRSDECAERITLFEVKQQSQIWEK